MADDYEYGKNTNSLSVEPLAQPASAGSTVGGEWAMKSLFKNLSQTAAQLHSHPLSSSAESHYITTSLESKFIPTRSYFTSYNN